jgi:hypothetical protein
MRNDGRKEGGEVRDLENMPVAVYKVFVKWGGKICDFL